MIIDHTSKEYLAAVKKINKNSRYNGAFYYSKEIVKNIIPNVTTDRNWVTIRAGEKCLDHSIVFIHNNLNPERYNFLSKYKDLILICGVPETCYKVQHLGKAIYLPLSVDVEYVKQFKISADEQIGTCYVGRKNKTNYNGVKLPNNISYLCGLERTELLKKLAHYRKAYAVGRTAIEAKILGLEVFSFDPRYPNPNIWKPIDNKEAAEILQKQLNKIDKKENFK